MFQPRVKDGGPTLAPWLLALAVACSPSATPPAAPAAVPSPSPTMPAKPAIVSVEQFLDSRQPGVVFQVVVEGPGIESFLEPRACGYFEWVYGERSGGEFTSFSVAYQSKEPVVLLAEGKRFEAGVNRIRAYLTASFEREYAAGDAGAPEVVKQFLAEGHPKAWAAEYRLEVGKTYWAVVHQDAYHLPPEGPDDSPRAEKRQVLRLSDRPFADGRPQGQMTPAYRGWTY